MERGANSGGRLWERGAEIRVEEALHKGCLANSLSAEDDEFGFYSPGRRRCYGSVCGCCGGLEARICGKRHDRRCRSEATLHRQMNLILGPDYLEVDAHYRVGNTACLKVLFIVTEPANVWLTR